MSSQLSRCGQCGAPSDAARLYCAFCGASRALDGVRLAEALRLVNTVEAEEVIPYGAVLPASYTDTYATAIDDQETIHVHLVVGNSARLEDTRTLVNLTLPLRQRGRAAAVRVVVTARVEIDGALSLRVEELGADNVFVRNDFRIGVARPR